MQTEPALSGVTIEEVEPFLVDLPAIRQMVLAGGASAAAGSTTPRVLVKVTDSEGGVGWGESRGNPRWNEESVETVREIIRSALAPAVRGRELWDLDGLHRVMDRAVRGGFGIGHPVAKAGIDVAVHDLIGRRLGEPIHRLLGGLRTDEIELGWVVTSTDADGAVRETEEGLQAGYRAFKIKIGIHGPEGDIHFVEKVRDVAGPEAYLWVDANQGYTVDQALLVAQAITELDVDAFEQPVAANNLTGLRRLIEHSPIPIAVDESVRGPDDLLQLVALGAADVVVAKVQRGAGLWRTRQLCEVAEAAGLRIIGSGMSESDIGLAAGLHLFGRFGLGSPVDLNGRQFVESPFVGETVEVNGAVARVPTGPGLGIEIDEEAVRRLARS